MISNKTFLAKGHRALVYTAEYKGVKIAIKEKRTDSTADTINQEYNILKKLNKYKIGPKVIFSGDNYFGMELINGQRILEFIEKNPREKILKILEKILKQLKKLDELRINKEELTNPYKHIIVEYPKATLIDFERARFTNKPGNITQFCNFLSSEHTNMLLAQKRIFIVKMKMYRLGNKYKAGYSNKAFENIFNAILQHGLQERTYFLASDIPPGKVASYGDLASAANSKAFRFIGQCMHVNPFYPIVPCHRIIGSNGSLGGFASGLSEKIRLLQSEGIKIENNRIPKKYFYRF